MWLAGNGCVWCGWVVRWVDLFRKTALHCEWYMESKAMRHVDSTVLYFRMLRCAIWVVVTVHLGVLSLAIATVR